MVPRKPASWGAGAQSVNFTKPMLWEVAKVGLDYDAWVHAPTGQKTFRMFHSDVLEFGSSTPWYAIPAFWVPVIGWMMKMSLVQDPPVLASQSAAFNVSGSLIQDDDGAGERVFEEPLNLDRYGFALCLVLGVVWWTVVGYAIHRYLFHAQLGTEKSWLIMGHFLLHGQHHKFPMDSGRLVLPIVPCVVLSFLIYSGSFWLVMPFKPSMAAHAGFMCGYLAYDLTHYYCHFGGSDPDSIFAEVRRSHMDHHYKDQSKGYGILTTFWDTLLDTSNGHGGIGLKKR